MKVVAKGKKRRREEEIQTESQLAEEQVKRTRVVRYESHARCDVSSHELVVMIQDSLTQSLETIFPSAERLELLAEEMARDTVRNLRYGTPTPATLKAVPIREIEFDDPPLCKECSE